jgi:uncharacterized protein (DUF1501 family)
MREEQVTLLVFDALKQIKEGMLETHPDQPLLAMEETLDALRADTAHQKQAELLTRAQEKLRLSAEHTLEEYQQKLQTADASDGIAAFALLRGWFDSHQDDQDEQQQAAGAMLEHAFDFMEAAFGSGQEMVIFVTELNCDYYSVKFLQEYECERYFYYNKELLFDEGRSAIEKRLQNLGK